MIISTDVIAGSVRKRATDIRIGDNMFSSSFPLLIRLLSPYSLLSDVLVIDMFSSPSPPPSLRLFISPLPSLYSQLYSLCYINHFHSLGKKAHKAPEQSPRRGEKDIPVCIYILYHRTFICSVPRGIYLHVPLSHRRSNPCFLSSGHRGRGGRI